MPMSSMEIAQMNGAYQGAAMNQQHYAGMVGQQQWQPSQASPSQVDYGSRAVNRGAGFASSMAAPAMTIGAGLMGLDPFSMAFRGGAAGMSMGGMAGMAGGAIGGFALAAGGAAAVMYGVNQGFTGVQQQQQLQQQLGETYRFRNQFGGQGFTQGGMQNIGSMMRGMTTQQGPMGESTSFEELGRLAQNMARMGMDQGVRNAKDFSDKFRQMVKTLKEVATTMGTSLEEAQKMMGGMKNVGVFKTADQLRAFGLIKAGTDTGILSSSEMMSAGSIGSQISRSIGGTGKAGMNAGLKALSQIGTMQQMGLLTEDQIFNSTGLPGAEGRQALATQQLSSSGRFLGTARGRYFMASIAGKDGQLDPSDVMAYMQGSVSVEETRKRAYSNLRGVGRANFIRNEGRLKGAALEQFGGSADAMALMGWMGERGINVNTDSDRAMLFLQRNLHKGRDEADQIVEQVRNMPQILRQEISNAQESKFGTNLKVAEAHRGIEAIKHKFAKAQATLNAGLQQAGADLLSGMSRDADAIIGGMFGTKASFYQGNVLASSDIADMGGAVGRREGRKAFGFGVRGMDNLSMGLRHSVFSARGLGGDTDIGLTSSGMHGKGGTHFQTGLGRGGNGADLGLNSDAKQKLQNAWFSGISGQGMDRASSLMGMLEGMGPEFAGVAAKLRGAGETNRGSLIADLMQQTGTTMDKGFTDPARAAGLLRSKYTTADQGLEAMGAGLSGHKAKEGTMIGRYIRGGGVAGWLGYQGQEQLIKKHQEEGYVSPGVAAFRDVLGSLARHNSGFGTSEKTPYSRAGRKNEKIEGQTEREKWLDAKTSGWGGLANFKGAESSKVSMAAAEFMMSEGGTALTRGVLGTKDDRNIAQNSINAQLSELQGDNLDSQQVGRRDVLYAAGAALDIQNTSEAKGGADLTQDELIGVASRHGYDRNFNAMQASVQQFIDGGMAKRRAATAQLAVQAADRANTRTGGITAADKDSLTKEGVVGGDYVNKKYAAEQKRKEAGQATGDAQTTLLQEANKLEMESVDMLSKLTGNKRREFLKNTQGKGGTGWLTAAASQIEAYSSMLTARGAGRGTRDNRIAGAVGVKLSKKEQTALQGMSDSAAAEFLAGKAGGLSKEAIEDLTGAFGASRAGGKGGGGEMGVAGLRLATAAGEVSEKRLTAAKSAQDPSYDNNKITADTLKAALGPGGTVLQALENLKPTTGTKNVESDVFGDPNKL